ERASHLGYIAFDAAQTNKLGVSHVGDDMGERCFSGARRSGQDYRWQSIGFNRAPEQFSRRQNVPLSDKFLERARSHPRGQWRSFIRYGKIDIFLFEQVLHM